MSATDAHDGSTRICGCSTAQIRTKTSLCPGQETGPERNLHDSQSLAYGQNEERRFI